MRYLLGAVAAAVGIYGGLEIPDVDQSIGLLRHRSIVTHGLLIPLLIFVPASSSQSVPYRWFAMGLCMGFGVHLAFDLFPRAWTGYALISIPGIDWTSAWFSRTWIAFSAVSCTYMSAMLLRGRAEALIFLLLLGASFAYAARGEAALWGPLVVLVLTAAFAVTRRLAAGASSE